MRTTQAGEPTPGLEPGGPFITSEVLYQLSYVDGAPAVKSSVASVAAQAHGHRLPSISSLTIRAMPSPRTESKTSGGFGGGGVPWRT